MARGIAPSRARAQAMIAAGEVMVDERVITKPAFKITDQNFIEVDPQSTIWVSRAALKLVAGLDAFGIDCAGAVALDVGASTGGFTQVLLDRGAARVYALDVGHGQLHESLRNDQRVINMERLNAKDLSDTALPMLDIIVSDVSFISLTKALPRALTFAKPDAHLVALIKPQFEAGPGGVGKGGIVRDETVRLSARAGVRAFLEAAGWHILGETESPITGSDGNVEYLIGAIHRP